MKPDSSNFPSIRLAVLGSAEEKHFRKWFPALRSVGIEVHLMSFHTAWEPLEGVVFHPLALPFGAQKPAGWVYHAASVRATRDKLVEIRPDVLMGSFATHYGALAARTGFHPFVLQTWTRDTTVHPFVGRLAAFYHRAVLRAGRTADLITTDGPALGALFQQNFPELSAKVLPVTWGIVLSDFEVADRTAARGALDIPADAVVLTHGRGVLPYYQPMLALPALQEAIGQDKHLFGVVLTLGQQRTQDVQALLEQMAAHPRIRVFDRLLPLEDVRRIWAATDGLISIPEYDGVSETLLEGLYAGCTPVLNDIPSNRAMFPEGRACYVHATDALALADEFRIFVQNLPDYQQNVPANRQWVANYASVESTARQFRSALEALLKRSEGSSSADFALDKR